MANNPYVDFAVEQFEPLGTITAKAMFGGHTLYCDGIPFALIAGGAVYLKADDQNRPCFEARSLAAFRPFPDRPLVLQYYELPAEAFEDPLALRLWGGGAVDAGRRAQARRTRGKQAGKKRGHLEIADLMA